jgi:hypothetical protein
MLEDRQGPHFLADLLTEKPRLVQRGFSLLYLHFGARLALERGQRPAEPPGSE